MQRATFNALIKAGAKKGAQKALMHIQGEKAEEDICIKRGLFKYIVYNIFKAC